MHRDLVDRESTARRECPSRKLRCDLKGGLPVQGTILKPQESAGRPDLKAVVPTALRTLKAFSRAAAQEVAKPLPRQVPTYAGSATRVVRQPVA